MNKIIIFCGLFIFNFGLFATDRFDFDISMKTNLLLPIYKDGGNLAIEKNLSDHMAIEIIGECVKKDYLTIKAGSLYYFSSYLDNTFLVDFRVGYKENIKKEASHDYTQGKIFYTIELLTGYKWILDSGFNISLMYGLSHWRPSKKKWETDMTSYSFNYMAECMVGFQF